MANTSSISLVNLDPNSLRADFVDFLRTQDQFKDYDFNDSNISVLLEILTQNTFKNGFLTNMQFSESYLDSAQVRESVTSKAKELNYCPRSVRSPSALVRVSFTATGENRPYTIPRGSSFTTIVKNDTYIYTTVEDISVTSETQDFTFDAYIYEGTYVRDAYVFDGTKNYPSFRMTNKDVDTTSLIVYVIEDNSDIIHTYTLAHSLLGLSKNSKKYFLQVDQFGYYEIVFGDNVIGKKPKNNATIVLEYRTTKGPSSNGAKLFGANFDPTNPNDELLSTPVVTLLEISQNGADKETNESIKYYAPRYFQTQERGVISTDYEILLKTQFPEINTLSQYGGEEVNPPKYGKVYIAVDIANIDGLPDSKILEYTNFLKSKSMFTPVFVEPDYLYFKVNSKIKYNINITNSSKDRIKTLAINFINDFNLQNLNDFNSTLRYSKFCSLIDSLDSSIESNDTEILLYKKIDIDFEAPKNYTIDFGVPLKNDIPYKSEKHHHNDEYTIMSSNFKYNGLSVIFEDDGEGIIRISRSDGIYNNFMTEIGTVDYDTGVVVLKNFIMDDYDGTFFKIYAVPRDKDISSSKKTILTNESSENEITVEEIRA